MKGYMYHFYRWINTAVANQIFFQGKKYYEFIYKGV